MRNLLVLFATTLCAVAALKSEAKVQDECPVLEGHYESEGSSKAIFERRYGTLYFVTLGEGALEMNVDGEIHSTPDEGLKYMAWCSQGTLNIKVTFGEAVGFMKYYFKDSRTLIEENHGLENFVKVWTKK